ncbi:MAG: D-glucuronyl C5-epimerase family protein [Thermoleophilaceae bacterium]
MRRAALLLIALVAFAAPAAAQADGPTLGETLDTDLERGRISESEHREYHAVYRRVRSALRRLEGGPKAALDGALDNVRDLADERRLDGRLRPTFLILRRNWEWFWAARKSVPRSGDRVMFEGSRVIFQFYSGQGWQLQALANFGHLNALLTGRRVEVEEARTLADDLLNLSVSRGGDLALEYYFPFSGGGPGWVSGMAQATGLQALARLWKATGDQRYLEATRPMLDLMRDEPPNGVQVSEHGEGPHFLLYSQAPTLLVGNGFAQALVGLHDYAEITGEGRDLLEAGLSRARSTMREFDTGAWSLYYRRAGTDDGRESSLHYHRLFTTFLGRLCERTADDVFCSLETSFAAYEKRPVRIGRLRTSTRDDRLTVRVWTSKRGSGRLTLFRGDRAIRSHNLALSRGTHVIPWPLPPAGDYRLVMTAKSPTGFDSRNEKDFEVSGD